MSYVLFSYGSEIQVIIKNVNLIYLPIVILLSIFQYLLSAWRWHFIALNTKSKIDYHDAIKFYYISGFLNNILPTGILGDIYRTMNIKVNNEKGNILKSFQSVIFERLSGQVSLLVTFILSLAFLFFMNKKYEAFFYTLTLIIILILLTKLFFKYNLKSKYINNFKYIFSGKLFYKHFFCH